MSEPRSRMLTLGSGRPTVEVVEAGQGPNLFFLHGAGGVAWAGALPLLARHFHVYAPVLPGFGKSAPEGLELLEDQLDLFQHGFDVMEALGLEKPLLVGESFGGWIAAEMAALRPKEVGKLAVLAPVGLWRDVAAEPFVVPLLGERSSLHNRRVAAEALGRMASPVANRKLLNASAALDSTPDRVLEHSLIFALIEIGYRESTATGLNAESPATRRVALIALDQMPGGRLDPLMVAGLLGACGSAGSSGATTPTPTPRSGR
jgi:pimeloyl-ACP methyl ester carboxylesterase